MTAELTLISFAGKSWSNIAAEGSSRTSSRESESDDSREALRPKRNHVESCVT